jgi:uncharacterized cupredoxin-like copper-binding protein
MFTRSLPRAMALAAALASGPVLAHSPGETHAHAHSAGEMHEHMDFGEAGNPRKPARVVQIVMREQEGKMMFVPDRVELRKGEQIRFALSNEGMVNHEFILGTQQEIDEHAKDMKKNPGMEHDDAHSRTLGMYGSEELLWHFTKAGHFVFACLIPGHLEKGMIGTVIVNEKK